MLANSFLVLLLIIAFAQSGKKSASEFEALKRQSIEELKLKTEAAVTIWGFGKFARWDMDQDVGDLIFTDPDGRKAVAPAQIIGTYYAVDHTWLWAWDNASINDKLKVDSLQLKKYGEEHHIEKLTTRKWVGTENDAWEMAALAVKLCGKQGAFRGPSGETSAMIVFGQVKLSRQ